MGKNAGTIILNWIFLKIFRVSQLDIEVAEEIKKNSEYEYYSTDTYLHKRRKK